MSAPDGITITGRAAPPQRAVAPAPILSSQGRRREGEGMFRGAGATSRAAETAFPLPSAPSAPPLDPDTTSTTTTTSFSHTHAYPPYSSLSSSASSSSSFSTTEPGAFSSLMSSHGVETPITSTGNSRYLQPGYPIGGGGGGEPSATLFPSHPQPPPPLRSAGDGARGAMTYISVQPGHGHSHGGAVAASAYSEDDDLFLTSARTHRHAGDGHQGSGVSTGQAHRRAVLNLRQSQAMDAPNCNCCGWSKIAIVAGLIIASIGTSTAVLLGSLLFVSGIAYEITACVSRIPRSTSDLQ